MERRLTAGAPKREDTTTERLMREFEQRIEQQSNIRDFTSH